MLVSDEEQEILKKRTDAFPEFLRGISPGISELASYIGIKNVNQVLDNLELFLQRIDDFFGFTDLYSLTKEQKIWLNTRLMYFVGELLIHRHGGFWFLQADPESDLFLQYVVGDFEDGVDPAIIIDPGAIAYNFIGKPPGRSLKAEIDALDFGNASRK